MKKNIIYIIISVIFFSMCTAVVNAAPVVNDPSDPFKETTTEETSDYNGSTNVDYSSICSLETEGNKGIRQTFKMVGYFIQLIKWIVPLIIIVLGMIDFGKASINTLSKLSSIALSML